VKPIIEGFSKPQTDRRKFLLGLAFCAAAGVAAWRQPRTKLDYLGSEKLEDLVPKSIGPWHFVSASGLVVPPEDEYQKSIYSQVLTRVYSDGKSPPIMLLIAQNGSQTGFLQVHRPENCYKASGYRISDLGPHPIRLGSSKVLMAQGMEASLDGPAEHVLFWTRVGDKLPTTLNQQKLAVAEQNLHGIIPDAILVRISVVDVDEQTAFAIIDQFTRALLESIPAAKQAVFVV
jgi:EpsI family protein